MFALRRSMTLVFVLLIALMPGLVAWPPAPEQATVLAALPRVAYIYQADGTAAGSFKALLNLRGYDVVRRCDRDELARARKLFDPFYVRASKLAAETAEQN